MRAMDEATLLRVFVGEEDRHEGRPLYQVIVEQALALQLAGATVLHAPLGFGPSRRVRSELYTEGEDRRPIVVEIVDSQAKIDAFLPVLKSFVDSGLVTLEGVRAYVIDRKG